MFRKLLLAGAMLPVLANIGQTHAAVLYSTSGTTYLQNFDTLPNSGSPSWVNDSTLSGWSLFAQPAPGSAPPTITAGDGSSNAGAFNSFGTTGSTERAFGGTGSGGTYFNSPLSGSVAGWITVGITNVTGASLDSFTVQYDGEQWRNGGNASAQTMGLQYGFGASFGAVSTWNTPGGSFDFTSPVVGATAAALDGNLAANRVANLGGTISSLNWNAGDTLWVRWTENNDIGNDHGLSVDNVRFSATAVPEPTTLGIVGLGALSLFARKRSAIRG